MKNIIVFYTTFLLLSLFSACTKKDKPVVYPTTGGPVGPIAVTGDFAVGANSNPITDFSNSGSVLSFKSGGYSVKITFNNASLAAQTYTTKATVAADNEVKIEVTDTSNGEVYVVESDNELQIQTGSANGITVTAILLAGAEANPTVDATRGVVNVSFNIVK